MLGLFKNRKRRRSTSSSPRRSSKSRRKSSSHHGRGKRRSSLHRTTSAHSRHSRASIISHHPHENEHRHHGSRDDKRRSSYQLKMLKRLQDFDDAESNQYSAESLLDMTHLSADQSQNAVHEKPKGFFIGRMSLTDWCGFFAALQVIFGATLLAAKIAVILKGKQGRIDVLLKGISKNPIPLPDYIEAVIGSSVLIAGVILFVGAAQVANIFNAIHSLVAFANILLIILDIIFVHLYSSYWWLTWLLQVIRACWVFLFLLFALTSLLLYKRAAFTIEQCKRPVPQDLRRLSLLHQHHRRGSVINP